jgi:hypothetical protein
MTLQCSEHLIYRLGVAPLVHLLMLLAIPPHMTQLALQTRRELCEVIQWRPKKEFMFIECHTCTWPTSCVCLRFSSPQYHTCKGDHSWGGLGSGLGTSPAEEKEETRDQAAGSVPEHPPWDHCEPNRNLKKSKIKDEVKLKTYREVSWRSQG